MFSCPANRIRTGLAWQRPRNILLGIMVKARSVNNCQRRPVDDCSPGRRGMAQNSGRRAEHFMAKWIAAEKAKKAGLRHTIVSPSVTGRTRKRIAQSKQGRRAGSLALIASHKWRELVSTGRLACRYHDVFLWCYVCFVFASFSSLCAFVEAAALRSIVLRYAGAPIATRVSFCSSFCFPYYVHLEMSLFPSIFCTIAAFSLNGEYVVRSFLPNGVFLPCNHKLDF